MQLQHFQKGGIGAGSTFKEVPISSPLDQRRGPQGKVWHSHGLGSILEPLQKQLFLHHPPFFVCSLYNLLSLIGVHWVFWAEYTWLLSFWLLLYNPHRKSNLLPFAAFHTSVLSQNERYVLRKKKKKLHGCKESFLKCSSPVNRRSLFHPQSEYVATAYFVCSLCTYGCTMCKIPYMEIGR